MITRAEKILTFYIYALPFHSLVLTVLLTAGVSPILLKGIAAWKELLLIGAFLAVAFQVSGLKTPPRLSWMDAIACLWLIQIIAYCLLGRAFDADSTMGAVFLGARDWGLYLLPYFIGRFTTFTEQGSRRVFRALVWIGLITSAIGILEYLFVPTEWHVAIGVPRYFSELLGLDYSQFPNGLPPNYWAEVVGLPVRRAVSVYLSGQGFAVPFLIVWPAVLIAHLRGFSRRSSWLLLMCGAALLLTITRMTIVGCFLETLLVSLLFRKFKALTTIAVAVATVTVALFIASESFRGFVVDTITFTDTSSSARPGQWRDGFKDLKEHPFGNGLTAVGQTSSQLSGPGIGQEAGYLKVLNGLGVPGTLLYAGWFFGIWLKSRRMLSRLPEHQAVLCTVCLVASIGFLINNFAAPPDQSPIVMYVLSWLAGFVVQRDVEYHQVRDDSTVPLCGPLAGPAPAQ